MSSRDGRELWLSAWTAETCGLRPRSEQADEEACVQDRSLSTLSLPGECEARHCQGPMIQGQLPQENTWHASGCCNVMPASAATGLPRNLYPSLTLAWVGQSPLISCYFNPVLCGRGTDALRQPTSRGGAKSKAEPQELCGQRREREISSSSLRSKRLNLHNQIDVPCIYHTWIDNESS